MRALLLLLALLATACLPSHYPTPGGLSVTGVALSDAELRLLDEIHAATRQCFRDNGIAFRNKYAPRVRVQSTCWFDVDGYDEPQRGTTDLREVVIIGRDFGSFAHELGHYYARDRRETLDAPPCLCEHPIKFERLFKCEERPR